MLPSLTAIDALFTQVSFVWVTGPNGSGKSTLLRAFLAEKQSGQYYYVGHTNGLKPFLTVRETLTFWGRALGGCVPCIPDWLEPMYDKRVGQLSFGQARLLCLMRLHMAPRPLWVLDEPDAGLDTQTSARLVDWLAEHLSGGGHILMASHNSAIQWPKPHVLFAL